MGSSQNCILIFYRAKGLLGLITGNYTILDMINDLWLQHK